MTIMLFKRSLFAFFALFVVSLAVFAATQALPGDAAIAQLGRQATPAALEALRERMNLNAPFHIQYIDWLTSTLRGDLGISFTTDESVIGLIGSRVVNSLVLMACSGIVGIPLATALGIWMAIRRDRAGDHIAGVGLLILAALPEFVLSVLIVALLSTNVFHLFPAVSLIDAEEPLLSQLHLIVLPVLTLVIITLPYVARTVRASMMEALDSEYVAMARLKGVPEHRVILRHALPNIAGPGFQVTAQSLAYLAGGIVVVETVFQLPGIGYTFISSIQSRDLPVIQTLALLLATFYIVLNTIADIGTVAMTPTLRKGSR